MKRIDKKLWLKLCGYEPSKEMKIMILADVRYNGISLAEACAKYALPPLIIEDVNDTEPIEYDNPFRPAVYIKGIK